MVQKPSPRAPRAVSRGRGRPRAFEPETALAQAMDVFWSDGFAATSLDDISAATGLNRPSLYGAFGDKRALYLQAYGQYRKRMNESFAPLFASREPLPVKLRRILIAALDLYLSGPEGPRGCFTVLSAASEAIADPDLHGLVSDAIDETDRAFGRIFADGTRDKPVQLPTPPAENQGRPCNVAGASIARHHRVADSVRHRC